ncbi:hypothetical protein DB30_00006 [Enhygromyxa salina]|uniref:Uncharacterized protein n=1 Tax=Enhygromyxa salina TaxID=215803 RepID=A0A0C2DIK1_9BACT|nr:hypothetical protein DB30_00006 [Enhygromyxa salina]
MNGRGRWREIELLGGRQDSEHWAVAGYSMRGSENSVPWPQSVIVRVFAAHGEPVDPS